MKLCRECYKWRLSFEMAAPFWQIENMLTQFFKALTQAETVKVEGFPSAEFTPNHEECENCPVELRRLGHDPCVEMLIFDYDIGPLGKVVRLFSSLVGYDAVTEDGNVVAMIQIKVHNWLEEDDVQSPDLVP